jgi:hypothetical protein
MAPRFWFEYHSLRLETMEGRFEEENSEFSFGVGSSVGVLLGHPRDVNLYAIVSQVRV